MNDGKVNEALTEKASAWLTRFRRGQMFWSFAHHLSIFGSIICSVTSGVLLQINTQEYSVLASVLTTIAAALTAIATAGGFERKWRSNRLSRSKIDCLLIDIEVSNVADKSLYEKLKKIIGDHDQEIVQETSNQLDQRTDLEDKRADPADQIAGQAAP
ncbi:hypothetical protein [Enterobacter soli]|uniref:hypothetical protein n=1 Tax=Enterobacter soli TaxID=885040 RepID=UPI004046E61C